MEIKNGNTNCDNEDVNDNDYDDVGWWLLVGTYNPNKSQISNHLIALEKNIFGDFNSEMEEDPLSDFCSIHNLKSLIKVPNCFKSTDNPSCIDVILTNRPHSFQNSIALETGLSDFHFLTVTVRKHHLERCRQKSYGTGTIKITLSTMFKTRSISALLV